MRTILVLRSTAAGAMAMLPLLALAGCGNNSTPPQTSTTVTTTPGATAAPMAAPAPPTGGAPAPANAPGTNNVNAGPGGATGADSATADNVNKAIHTNVQMTGSRITAVVDASGVATLTGTAQNAQQKALAATAATNTPGVTSVKNKVEIQPTGGIKSPATPKVVTKTVIVHDNGGQPSAAGGAAAPSSGSGDTSTTSPSPSGATTDSDTSGTPATGSNGQ